MVAVQANNPYANSGMVVQVGPEDWEPLGFEGPLGGLLFQQAVEQARVGVRQAKPKRPPLNASRTLCTVARLATSPRPRTSQEWFRPASTKCCPMWCRAA